MTVRAIVLSVLGAIFIAAVGYFNDQVPRLNHFVGNQFPIIVFFPLLLIVAAINPLLHRFRARWAIGKAEVVVLLALLLVACNIPGSGLLRWWSRMVGAPLHYSHQNISWTKTEALSYAPRCLLANDGQYDPAFVESFWGGSGRAEAIALSEVPWSAWRRPIVSWMPLAVLFAITSVCLAIIVHRTWSARERLPYPIAQVAASLVQSPPGGSGSIFRSRLFLTGAVLVFLTHVANGAVVWHTGVGSRDPISFDFSAVFASTYPDLFRDIWQVPWGGNSVFYFPIYPTLVAFACFVAADVGFSVGISVVAWTIVGYVLVNAGVEFQWVQLEGGVMPWQTAGSSLALGLALVYLGRRYYWHLLRRAAGLRAGEDVLPQEVWACRVFVLGVVGLVLLLIGMGVAWPLAVLAIPLFLLAYVVIARITVESGMILVQMQWQPLAVLIGVFGVEATGLRALAVIAMLGFVFSAERRECLMPLMLNGLRICDGGRVSAGRLGTVAVAVFLIALVVAVPFGLWVDHNYGVSGGEGFSNAAPWYVFDTISRQRDLLAGSGQLGASESYSAIDRLAHASADRRCLWALAIGAAAVLAVMWLRLRYTWWPIHPILFLVWGTWAMRVAAFSFLLGWAIKTVATRFGVRFETLKTFMIGVIAGDLCGGIVWMIAGAIHFVVTGETPPRHHVFPGG